VNGEADDQSIANDLKRVLLRYGVYTVIISEIIEEILESQNAFFNLFNAFLSLGLIIGIIGLGIITLRAVYERRHEIGMMRAIGFRRMAVVAAFIGESAFIAGSGLIIGTILGIILGYILWRDSFGETMENFGIPWLKLLGIVGLAFGIAILSSIPPAFKAARVTPAEALRYE
jgi:putative ABC transport system permease protein